LSLETSKLEKARQEASPRREEGAPTVPKKSVPTENSKSVNHWAQAPMGELDLSEHINSFSKRYFPVHYASFERFLIQNELSSQFQNIIIL